MPSRIVTRIGLALLIAVSLVACSSGSSGSDPTAPVKAAMQLVESKQFDKVAEIACAAKKDEIAKALDFTSALGGSALPEGIDIQGILDAMTIKVSNLAVTEQSREGDKAVVAVKGTMEMTADPAKMKDFMKQVLKAEGIDASDAMIDAALAGMGDQFNQTQDIDSTINVVQENGKWLICDTVDLSN